MNWFPSCFKGNNPDSLKRKSISKIHPFFGKKSFQSNEQQKYSVSNNCCSLMRLRQQRTILYCLSRNHHTSTNKSGQEFVKSYLIRLLGRWWPVPIYLVYLSSHISLPGLLPYSPDGINSPQRMQWLPYVPRKITRISNISFHSFFEMKGEKFLNRF
jgi:hypothetical protein